MAVGRWARAVAAGAAILAVVVWKLTGSSYRRDVEVVCGAEARSGLSLGTEMQALGEWTRGQVSTAAGQELLARLGDAPFAERAPVLRAAAAAAGVDPCPMAASYDRLAAEGACRADLQRLCSYVTFPDLAGLDDAARLDAIEDWLDRDGGLCARAQAAPLRAAGTPADRAHVLREASRAAGILTCDVAKVVEAPPPDAGSDASGGD